MTLKCAKRAKLDEKRPANFATRRKVGTKIFSPWLRDMCECVCASAEWKLISLVFVFVFISTCVAVCVCASDRQTEIYRGREQTHRNVGQLSSALATNLCTPLEMFANCLSLCMCVYETATICANICQAYALFYNSIFQLNSAKKMKK